jgi:hypothetical protein
MGRHNRILAGLTPAHHRSIFNAYALPPWHQRLPVGHDNQPEVAMDGTLVVTSASGKARRISIGSIVHVIHGGRQVLLVYNRLERRPGHVHGRSRSNTDSAMTSAGRTAVPRYNGHDEQPLGTASDHTAATAVRAAYRARNLIRRMNVLIPYTTAAGARHLML